MPPQNYSEEYRRALNLVRAYRWLCLDHHRAVAAGVSLLDFRESIITLAWLFESAPERVAIVEAIPKAHTPPESIPFAPPVPSPEAQKRLAALQQAQAENLRKAQKWVRVVNSWSGGIELRIPLWEVLATLVTTFGLGLLVGWQWIS